MIKEALELLLTVNHYKYVLKFCNINHSRGPAAFLHRGGESRGSRGTLQKARCGGEQDAGVNPPNKTACKQEPALIVRSGKSGVRSM